jgi:hypothetical protein
MPPGDDPIRVLVLNASLKKSPEISNTGELAELVLENMAPYGVSSEIVGWPGGRR